MSQLLTILATRCQGSRVDNFIEYCDLAGKYGHYFHGTHESCFTDVGKKAFDNNLHITHTIPALRNRW